MGVYVQVPGHALVVLRISGNTAYMLQNYSSGSKIEKWPLSRFLSSWEGVGCCPKHKPKKPVVLPMPEPATPAPAPKVEPATPTPPPQDLSKITDGLGRLVDSVTIVNKSVATLTDKVTTIDQRLVTVEGKLASPPPTVSLPPPSTVTPDPRIQEVQDKLAKLEASLKQSGTLHITVSPK